MIQRIQSIYLLLVAVFISFVLVRPYAFLSLNNGNRIIFRAQSILQYSGTGELLSSKMTIPLLLTVIAAGLLSLVTIFLYNRRILQIRLCIINTLLLVAILIIMAIEYLSVKAEFSYQHNFFKATALLPILGIIMNILAYRAIHADESLVNSYNRIR